MPDCVVRAYSRDRSRRRPAAWHPLEVQPGAETFCLERRGELLSRRYCATRVAELVDRAGTRVLVRVDGYGWAWTAPGARRRGYATRLMQASRELLAARGFDASLLFCLAPLVAFYRDRGWRVYEEGEVTVTFHERGRVDPCPPGIHLGYWPLVTQTGSGQALPGPDELAAVEVEGAAW